MLAACRATGTFACATDDQCRRGDTGTCQPTGYCSFADGACPSGQRYDPTAGGGLAGTCSAPIVDAAIDAPPPFTVRINLGGPTFVGTTDYPGTWTGDPTNFTCPQNAVVESTAMSINGTVDGSLFMTQVRANNVVCAIPNVPAGNYQVTLLFAEIRNGTPCPNAGGGDRRFNVVLEGVTVATIDVNVDGGGCAIAGGPGYAFARTYASAIADGTLNVDLTNLQNGGILSAIQIVGS